MASVPHSEEIIQDGVAGDRFVHQNASSHSKLVLRVLRGFIVTSINNPLGARMAILSNQPKKRTRLYRLGSVYIGAFVFAWGSPEFDEEV
ncbi:hypothetical protein TNCV_1958391 [Trichonephila clavipes]|nr:hypothetical protein TNCV_1958391 [Trichonephila clavipes]